MTLGCRVVFSFDFEYTLLFVFLTFDFSSLRLGEWYTLRGLAFSFLMGFATTTEFYIFLWDSSKELESPCLLELTLL